MQLLHISLLSIVLSKYALILSGLSLNKKAFIRTHQSAAQVIAAAGTVVEFPNIMDQSGDGYTWTTGAANKFTASREMIVAVKSMITFNCAVGDIAAGENMFLRIRKNGTK